MEKDEKRLVAIPAASLVFNRTKNVPDKLKLYTYLIQIHCMLQGVYLPNGELTLLAYYATFGVSSATETKFREDCQRTKQVLANTKYKLSKFGLLTKHENSNAWELPNFLKYNLEKNITFILNFERENDRSTDLSESV